MTDSKTPLSEVLFAFVDVETTGLRSDWGHRICEIAILRSRGGQVLETYNSLVNPQRAVDPGAYRVHRIPPQALDAAPPFAEIAEPVARLFEGAVIVAHNAPFDLGFLAAEWRRLRWPPWSGQVVDTLALARSFFSFSSNSLSNVAANLGVFITETHRALADVETTMGILETMLRHLEQRWQVRTLGDLLEAQGGTVPWTKPSGLRHQDLPAPLTEALRQGRRLWLRYISRNGSCTERWVEPVDVSGPFLIAFCHLRQEQRTFRLDRIVEMRMEE